MKARDIHEEIISSQFQAMAERDRETEIPVLDFVIWITRARQTPFSREDRTSAPTHLSGHALQLRAGTHF